MNKIINLLWVVLFYCLPVGAQDVAVISGYLEKTGDYASFYKGSLEMYYDSRKYENFPYYKSHDFTEGTVVYKQTLYPRQQVRLDLYKELLIVLTPKTNFGITVDPECVEKVEMYGKTFVWKKASKESGLQRGFYMLLFEGNSLELLCKESQIINRRIITYFFTPKINYYVLLNGRYHSVKNKGSFIKLFPQYKKQINAFAKAKKLNFKRNADESLTVLAAYCEELASKGDNQ